jgi:hypothetical protein
MPDLLGPNPQMLRNHDSSVCWNQGCSEYTERVPGCCSEGRVDGECEDRYQLSDYGRAVADRLLEALKAGGVKVKDDKLKTWGAAGAEIANKSTGPGHLIFIPEAQE